MLYFRETLHMQSFAKVKSSQNGKITLSFTDIGKSCTSRESQTSLICILTLFAKIKISRIFPDFASKSGFLAAKPLYQCS